MLPENRMAALPWTRLPFHFDAAALQHDVDGIAPSAWQPHFHTDDYEGDWSIVALRSRSGVESDILAQGTPEEFQDTPLLARSPGLQAVVEQFQMPLKSVRLMRLHAGSRVREHRDRDLGLADGEIRIHVPIQTSDAVEFIVANRRLRLREGESWYIDFSQPHRIYNGGSEPRTHLVVDGLLNEWAASLLNRSVEEVVTETEEPAGFAALRDFCETVFESPALQEQFLGATDRETLMAAVVQQGERDGFHFHQEDVASLIQFNRQSWLMRSLSI